jgi:Ni/Co efflux regulator RcnB
LEFGASVLPSRVVKFRELLTMKNHVFAGVATTALLLTASAVSASDSFAPTPASAAAVAVDVSVNGAKPGGMRMPGHVRGVGAGAHMPKPGGMHMPRPGGVHMPRPHNPRPNMGNHHGPRGNWHGGNNAPGGYASYRRPFRGFIMPSYWINPGFQVSNYYSYGLRAPTNGYNWSRYYDDAVLTDQRGYVYDSVSNVPWQAAQYQPAPVYNTQPVYAPTISTDQSVYGEYDLPQNSTTQAGTYDGQWTGAYVDDKGETYRGEWEGTYENEQGQRYEGTYRGTAVGAPVYSGGTGSTGGYGYTTTTQSDDDDRNYPSAYDPGVAYGNGGDRTPTRSSAPDTTYGNGGDRSIARYPVPGGYEAYERCLRNRGIAGGAIGAILGSVAGNRIAGRGNRLPGTLIGGGIGAIAGIGVEKLANKCTKYLPREQYYPQQQGYPQQGYPQHYPQQVPQAFGWYYPPQPAPVTTITITPGTMTSTTTTTEEVIYENVYSHARPKGKALRRPAPSRKRCGC